MFHGQPTIHHAATEGGPATCGDPGAELSTPDHAAANCHGCWARTHCYLCGREFTAREAELFATVDFGNPDAPEAVELRALQDAGCSCWAEEEAAHAAGIRPA